MVIPIPPLELLGSSTKKISTPKAKAATGDKAETQLKRAAMHHISYV
jgi:hypothetical protein